MKQLCILCHAELVSTKEPRLLSTRKGRAIPLKLCGTARLEVQTQFCKITKSHKNNEAFRMCSEQTVHAMVSEVDLGSPPPPPTPTP